MSNKICKFYQSIHFMVGGALDEEVKKLLALLFIIKDARKNGLHGDILLDIRRQLWGIG